MGTRVAELLQTTQDFAWLAVPSCLFLAGLIGLLKKRLGDPNMWAFAHELLDDFRNKVFSDAGSDYQHHHRVTLFRHLRWVFVRRRWPWSGWLCPVERSGHTTQVSKALFRAPDEADDSEGVAGLGWCANGALKIDKLPELRKGSNDDILVSYAASTGVSLEFVRTHLPKTRSFYAVRVEVKGVPWGVLVVDSRKETINFSKVDKHYDVLGRYLSLILQRI